MCLILGMADALVWMYDVTVVPYEEVMKSKSKQRQLAMLTCIAKCSQSEIICHI